MASRAVFINDTVVSDVAAAVNGKPVYVDGNPLSVHTKVVAGTLAAIQISNDKANWVDHTTGLGNAVTAVTTRPRWVRGRVAIDAGGPVENHFGFSIFKETE